MSLQNLQVLVREKLQQLDVMIKMKSGFQRFCDFTSMHGFTELFHAKALFWTLFWVVSIGLALGMTVFQVYQAIQQYMTQSSSTIVQSVENDEIIYPPLKLCYTHWIDWVDFQKGYSLQFSKASLLYGLSFLTNIYTTTWFNMSEAKANFTSTLQMNNISTLSDFYKSIARFAPLRLIGPEEEFFGFNYSITGGPYFSHMEFMTYQMGSLLFCHVQTGEEVMSYITNSKSSSVYTTNANILTFALNDENYFTFYDDINRREYNSYMAEWIQEKTPQYWIFDDDYEHASHDYTGFNAPMIMFPDGYSNVGIKMAPEVDEYFITIKASAHRWKNTQKAKCNTSTRSVISDNTCTDICVAKLSFTGQKSSFASLFRFNEDFLANAIENTVYFINETNITLSTGITNLEITSIPMQVTTNIVTLQPNNITTSTAKYLTKANCSSLCLQGCEKWNFEVGVTTSSIYSSIHQLATKKRTNIQVDYPLDGDILMMIETDSETWESFVGNVGGLLGIWTGASILSFVQLFYLCCCADSDCSCHPSTWFPKRNVFNHKNIHENHGLHGMKNINGVHDIHALHGAKDIIRHHPRRVRTVVIKNSAAK